MENGSRQWSDDKEPPFFFFSCAKNNSQTTLAIVIASVKCVPTLQIIHSSCLESCGVCDRELVCIVGEFKPTDTTTDGSEPNGHVCGLASAPDRIPGEMSRHLSPRTAPKKRKRKEMTGLITTKQDQQDKVCMSHGRQSLLCVKMYLLTVCGPQNNADAFQILSNIHNR